MRTALVLSLILLATAAPFTGAGAPAPCTVPDFVPGVQKLDADVGGYVQARFRVDAPLSGVTIWGAASFHGATTAVTDPLYYGYAAERAGGALFVETASGAPVGEPGGFLMYPYGIQATAADITLRVVEQDHDICGAAAAGSNYDFAPGDYVATVLAGSDTPNAGALLLPLSVEILSVARGPSSTISEASLACDAKVHAMAVGFTSATLVGCEQTLATTSRGYHAIFSGRFPDPTHQVRYDPAVGSTRQIAFFDADIEAPGQSALLVPQYITPAGNPLYLPLPVGQPAALGSDSGIFGLFADI